MYLNFNMINTVWAHWHGNPSLRLSLCIFVPTHNIWQISPYYPLLVTQFIFMCCVFRRLRIFWRNHVVIHSFAYYCLRKNDAPRPNAKRITDTHLRKMSFSARYGRRVISELWDSNDVIGMRDFLFSQNWRILFQTKPTIHS
jgi:hypothetical protein